MSFSGGDFEFVGQTYVAPMGLQSIAETVNFYVEKSPEANSKMPNALLGCPGLLTLFTPTVGQVRGMYVLPGSTQALVVVGSGLYLVTISVPATAYAIPQYSYALIGTLNTLIGQVSMRDNGVLQNGLGGYVLIVDGTYCYYYWLNGSSHTITFQATTATSSNTITFNGTVPNGMIVTAGATLTDSSGVIPAATKITAVNTISAGATISHAATGSVTNDSMTLTIPAFGVINDPGFLGAQKVDFIEGFLIFNQPNSRTFFCTGPGPYTVVFPGLYFALKDSSTDNLVTLYAENRELWLIGERTSEVWYNSGGSGFPFSRIPGVAPQIGCAAVYSVTRCDKQLVWLGRNEQGQNLVVCSNNYTWARISTHAIEHLIASFTIVSDAIGYGYEEDGHIFYMLTFPTADVTLCFDFTSGAWHKRLSFDTSTGLYHRHYSNCFMDFGDVRMVGDYQNGNVYQMSRQYFDDNGSPIRAMRRTGPVWNKENRERIFHSQLQVEFTPGVGLQGVPVAGSGLNVVLLLHFAGTNGQTTTVDSSLVNNAMTSRASAQTVTSPAGPFGASCWSCPAPAGPNGNVLYTPISAGAPLDLTNVSAWTIEGWIYFNSSLGGGVATPFWYGSRGPGGGGNVGISMTYPGAGGQLQMTIYGPTSGPGTQPTATGLTAFAWHHFAMVKTPGGGGDTYAIFLDGVGSGFTTAFTGPYASWATGSSGYVTLGGYYDRGYVNFSGGQQTWGGGYFAEVEVTSGVAKYLTNFTPPTGPFANPSAAIPGFSSNSINPQMMLRWSDDGGFTWSNERQIPIGLSGQTKNRAIARQLGQARDRIYEVSISDPVQRDIIGATLFAEGGT